MVPERGNNARLLIGRRILVRVLPGVLSRPLSGLALPMTSPYRQ
jgi:hypothetical protein